MAHSRNAVLTLDTVRSGRPGTLLLPDSLSGIWYSLMFRLAPIARCSQAVRLAQVLGPLYSNDSLPNHGPLSFEGSLGQDGALSLNDSLR